MNDTDIDISIDTDSTDVPEDILEDTSVDESLSEPIFPEENIDSSVVGGDINNTEISGTDIVEGDASENTEAVSFDASGIEAILQKHNEDFVSFRDSTISGNDVSGNGINVIAGSGFQEYFSESLEMQTEEIALLKGLCATSSLLLVCMLFLIMDKFAKRIIGNMISKPDERK